MSINHEYLKKQASKTKFVPAHNYAKSKSSAWAKEETERSAMRSEGDRKYLGSKAEAINKGYKSKDIKNSIHSKMKLDKPAKGNADKSPRTAKSDY